MYRIRPAGHSSGNRAAQSHDVTAQVTDGSETSGQGFLAQSCHDHPKLDFGPAGKASEVEGRQSKVNVGIDEAG